MPPADAKAGKAPAEAAAPSPGPPHGWLGTGIGLAASGLALVATVWLIGQYLKHRPLDLSQVTENLAQVSVDAMKHQGMPADLIEVTEPQLERTARANFYRTNITAHLPDAVDPDNVMDAVERALWRERVVISSEDTEESQRTAYLSLDGLEIGELHLYFEAPKPHAAGPVSEEPEAAPQAPEAEHSLAPAPTPEPESEDANNDRAVAVPSGLWTPSFGEISEGARSKIAKAPARLAIIVDDGGYGGEATNIILGLDPALTFSILPNTPHGTTLAEEASRHGFEIMLHMPMENESETLRHPGQININMNADEIHSLTELALAQVPHAIGINNHTGSKFTADASALRLFMRSIQDTGLYFVDSRTTAKSVAYDIACEYRIPAAARTLFLDHDNARDSIRARFEELIQEARSQGSALGICHFRPNTADILREMLPRLPGEGVQLVHASELVR